MESEFSGDKEVVRFSSLFIPLLTQAMKLRGLCLPNAEYYVKAREIKKQMRECLAHSYDHLAIKKIQQIFQAKDHRLYHWVENKDVPPENNAAERELRPTVKKRLPEQNPVEDWLKQALDKFVHDPSLNIYDLLPPPTS